MANAQVTAPTEWDEHGQPVTAGASAGGGASASGTGATEWDEHGKPVTGAGRTGTINVNADPVTDFAAFQSQNKNTPPAPKVEAPQSASDYLKGAVSGIGRGAKSVILDPIIKAAHQGTYDPNTFGGWAANALTEYPDVALDALNELGGSPQFARYHDALLKAIHDPSRANVTGAYSEFPVAGPIIRGAIDTYKNDPWALVGQVGTMAAIPEMSKAAGDLAATDANTIPAARAPFERAVFPTSATVPERAALTDIFDRAAKYIAPEAKGNYSFWDRWVGNRTGVAKGIGQIEAAQDKLWPTMIDPIMKQFGGVSRDVSQVAKDVMDSFTDVDRNSAAGLRQIRAAQQWTQRFNQNMTVQEMSDWVRQLNAEKPVSRFYSMTPEAQSAAMRADPALRAKVITVDSLRNQLFKSVDELGGPEIGQEFRDSRKDWGALETMRQMLSNDVKTPTPEPFTTRAANTVRAMFNPKGAVASASDTLMQSRDPNKLVAQSFGKLGKTGLEPNPPILRAQPTPITPPAPGQIPLNAGVAPPNPYVPSPVHAPGEAPPTPTGGEQTPMTPIPTSMVPAQPSAQGDIFATQQNARVGSERRGGFPPPPSVIDQPGTPAYTGTERRSLGRRALDKAKDIAHGLTNPAAPESDRAVVSAMYRMTGSMADEFKAQMLDAGLNVPHDLAPEMRVEIQTILEELPQDSAGKPIIKGNTKRVIEQSLKGDLSDAYAVGSKMRKMLGLPEVAEGVPRAPQTAISYNKPKYPAPPPVTDPEF